TPTPAGVLLSPSPVPPAPSPVPPAPSPVEAASRAAARPRAAAAYAAAQEAGRSTPSSSLTSGVFSRSDWVAELNAQRPLSQFHSSLTSGSSPARRRITLPRRWSVRWWQPDAQCSHTLGVDTRSNGRDLNRYAAPVSAPTGQTWTVLPEK